MEIDLGQALRILKNFLAQSSVFYSQRILLDGSLRGVTAVSLRDIETQSSFSLCSVTQNLVKGTKMTSLRPLKLLYSPTTLPQLLIIVRSVYLDSQQGKAPYCRVALLVETMMKLLNSKISPLLQSSLQPSLLQVKPLCFGSPLTCYFSVLTNLPEMELSQKELKCVKQFLMKRWIMWQRKGKDVVLVLILQGELNRVRGHTSPFLLCSPYDSSLIFLSSSSLSLGTCSTSFIITSPYSTSQALMKLTILFSKRQPTYNRRVLGYRIFPATKSPLLSGCQTWRRERSSCTWKCLIMEKLSLIAFCFGRYIWSKGGQSQSLRLLGYCCLGNFFPSWSFTPIKGIWTVSKMCSLRLSMGWAIKEKKCMSSYFFRIAVSIQNLKSQGVSSASYLQLIALATSALAACSDFHLNYRCTASWLRSSIIRLILQRSIIQDSALFSAKMSPKSITQDPS